MSALSEPPPLRREVRVRGRVQGVGFRPAICRFAAELALAGFVRNDRDGVLIEVEGAPASVDRFLDRLARAAPAAAHIESVETTPLPLVGEPDFRIAESALLPRAAAGAVSFPPDLAPCAACLAELADPADRRHRYPFINCTACGPRFTIIKELPYDRARTTMDVFALCAPCRREYEDPADRRFHAEATACPDCGPALCWVAPGAERATGEAALRAAVWALRRGRVVAVKGAGGFLLAVDARDEAAVARLRARKRRPHKPFAVMGGTLEALERVVELDAAAREALQSPARPIILLPARPGGRVARGVAPGLADLGVALPPTPLQHLLLVDGPELLVMTSGNVSDEPIARTDDEAFEALGGIADGFLLHDRQIHARADDSVARPIAGAVRVGRRARGYVPEPLALPFDDAGAPAVLAVGAELKTTLCLASDGRATLSQHVGDLGSAGARRFFEQTAATLTALREVSPGALAHDLHPDYQSSRWAWRTARLTGARCVAVQHHHAHVASCLVEYGRVGPVLGVVFDGTGLGTDGTLWGGEILLADLGAFRRLGHLSPLALPGGEAAIRAPWRLAVAALVAAGEALDVPALAPLGARRVAALAELARRPHLSPRATGAGRWFDAVAALCGLALTSSYDGQAPTELEAAAAGDHGAYEVPVGGDPGEPFVLDLRPAVRAIASDLRLGAAAPSVSARFHAGLAGAIVAGCVRARAAGGPGTVALTGGCFQNRRLTEAAKAGLEHAGFEVLLHGRVPCNDGGLALGQAAVASFRLAAEARGGRPCA